MSEPNYEKILEEKISYHGETKAAYQFAAEEFARQSVDCYKNNININSDRKMKRILVACEFSQVVTKAFRDLGFEAYSCDLEPGDINLDWHYQCDVLEILDKGWDLMIAHPPCTYLTVTGNKWFKPEYADRFPTRHQDREDAKEFFLALANAPIDKIAIENPIGIMSSFWRKPDQIIQPWHFGHEASKSTCLWLKNLPLLAPTNIVSKGEFTQFKSGKRMSKWYADAAKFDAKTRTKIRNITFQGIADAMADQWSKVL